MVEKIIAKPTPSSRRQGPAQLGIDAVTPGDALFIRTDVRFSHEYVTPMAESLFRQRPGRRRDRFPTPESVSTPSSDHLAFIGKVMDREEAQAMGLLERADGSWGNPKGSSPAGTSLKLYGELPDGGSRGDLPQCRGGGSSPCPGMVVTGTDSHTCMAGVLGCFAFGVGSTDMANSWYTRDIRVRVPDTVRFVLKGISFAPAWRPRM